MATTPSMQVCMETSDWLKAIVTEDIGSIDDNNSPSPSTELVSCVRSQPLLERRLRPPHDQALKCPRCDSTHTKFCYYNNYSLSQPRYFCKTCRRYWTKGGSLRNVPVGGGCRKNKRSTATKKPVDQPPLTVISHQQQHQLYQFQSTDLQLSNLNFMFDNPNHLFTGSYDIGLADHFPGMNSSSLGLGFPMEGLRHEESANNDAVEVKPGNRMLSLEWPEGGCSDSYNGYVNGLGLWAGMINGHGPSSSSAAM